MKIVYDYEESRKGSVYLRGKIFNNDGSFALAKPQTLKHFVSEDFGTTDVQIFNEDGEDGDVLGFFSAIVAR